MKKRDYIPEYEDCQRENPAPHVSDYYTPLYDNERGGPPRAFRCEQNIYPKESALHRGNSQPCTRVTRTLSGMKSHLRSVHGIVFQLEIFDATARKI